jgi:hypothetical protein
MHFDEPTGQGAAIALEAAKFAAALNNAAIGLFNEDRNNVQHAVHVDAGDTPIKWLQPFHDASPVSKIKGTHRTSMNWKTPRAEIDQGLFTVRATA